MCENVICDWPFKDVNGSIIVGKVKILFVSSSNTFNTWKLKSQANWDIKKAGVKDQTSSDRLTKTSSAIKDIAMGRTETRVGAGDKVKSRKDDVNQVNVDNKLVEGEVEKVKESQKVAIKRGVTDKEVFGQSKPSYQGFVKAEVMESSKVLREKQKKAEKKKKRGKEKFDKEFVRSRHPVGSLMKKVEKTNMKMEKLGRKKGEFAPVVSEGEQWFDASSELGKAEAGEKTGMEENTEEEKARAMVKKAEVKL